MRPQAGTAAKKKPPDNREGRSEGVSFNSELLANYTLISTSTPQGNSSFMSASTVLAVEL